MSSEAYGADGVFGSYMDNNANVVIGTHPDALLDVVEEELGEQPDTYEELGRAAGHRLQDDIDEFVDGYDPQSATADYSDCNVDVDAALKAIVAFERAFLDEPLDLGDQRREEAAKVRSLTGSFRTHGIDERRAAEIGWEIDRYDVENGQVSDDGLHSQTADFPDAPDDDGYIMTAAD